MSTRLLTTVIAAFLSIQTAAQAAKLEPVDEAAQDPSFQAFRQKLVEAVRNRDRKHLLSIVDPKIQFSFGAGPGIEGFKKEWKLDRPDSGLWSELAGVLSLGGSFDTIEGQRQFCAPYVYSRFPENLDATEYGCITGKDVNVRRGPSSSAPVTGRLSYDLVKVADWKPVVEKAPGGSRRWIKISTPQGGTGYVEKRWLRSAIDYRACFERKQGSWRMMVFIAGD
jgi:SH3 domain-containing protein